MKARNKTKSAAKARAKARARARRKAKARDRAVSVVMTVLCMAAALAIGVLACGCTRTVYVPVQAQSSDSTRTESTLSERQLQSILTTVRQGASTRDSVFVRDSVVVVVNQQGEVVSRERFRDTGRDRLQTQMLEMMQQRYDSILSAQREEMSAVLSRMEQVPVPVEQQMSTRQRIGACLSGVVAGIAVALLCWLGIRIYRRRTLKT